MCSREVFLLQNVIANDKVIIIADTRHTQRWSERKVDPMLCKGDLAFFCNCLATLENLRLGVRAHSWYPTKRGRSGHGRICGRSRCARVCIGPAFEEFLRVRNFNVLDFFSAYELCEQNTLTRHILSCFTAHISMSHVTLAQDVCPHHVIHASCAVVVLILFDSPFCTLHRLSHLPFHSRDLHLHLHLPCGLVRREVHSALPRMRS